jgi:SAM-dependent methyltransferase
MPQSLEAKSWEAWGRDDPYYGVLSLDRFRKGEHRAEFFESGRAFLDWALDRYERHFGAPPSGRALDYGCGVGRLSLPLTDRFETVTGIDISRSMLAEARRNAAAAGCSGATFIEGDSPAVAPGQFDFVTCYIVLQHVPRRLGLVLLRQMLEKIAPGGGCLIQVTVRRRGSAVRRALYTLRFAVPALRPLLNVLAGRPAGDPNVRMEEYPLVKVLDAFARAGLPEVVVTSEDHAGSMAVTLLARKGQLRST